MLTSQRQILVVEDNPAQARAIAFVLRRSGFEVTVAQNGDMAWSLLNQQDFALVVSDIVMPGISGDELCDLIRNDTRLAELPVILLTAKFLGSSSNRLAPQSPVRAVLAKPFRPCDLEAAVAACFADCDKSCSTPLGVRD